MIEQVYRRAAAARGVDAVVVATDDARIMSAVQAFGGVARMTRDAHRTGTDRIAEVVRDLSCAIVVNVQGDLPLVEPGMIEQVIEPLLADATLLMSTICCPIAHLDEYDNPNVVKVVLDRSGDALYFSRAAIPYVRDIGPPKGGPHVNDAGPPARRPAYRHIGMYGYRRDFLLEFASLPQTPLEQSESLEQLRALEHGYRIRVVETRHESVEVDTPDDLERARRLVTASARTRNAAEAFR
jgi:3-deoxy-manno-octulosonate cytidylyltransferase (CMP-KDO synthetase)